MDTEIYKLNKDIKLLCVTADSFPEGISGAFEKLHSILQGASGRNIFGISYPGKDGKIIYKAAVEEAYPGEAEKLGCEVFVLKKGNYTSTYIKNSPDIARDITTAFGELLANQDIDPNGCCVEMYSGNRDVRCMVRLESEK